jgi:type I restriction enzyme, R subunit
MQKIIDAEKSDLFDVFAYVAYALPILTREERADRAKVDIHSQFSSNQQRFLEFVLSDYVNVGVEGQWTFSFRGILYEQPQLLLALAS